MPNTTTAVVAAPDSTVVTRMVAVPLAVDGGLPAAAPSGKSVATAPAAESNAAAAETAARQAEATRQAAQRRWYAALLEKLREYRRYPPAARRLGQEGVVTLMIEIAADGELRQAEVRATSGYPLLDKAATHLLHEAAAALRGQMHPPGGSRLEIPVAYRLDG